MSITNNNEQKPTNNQSTESHVVAEEVPRDEDTAVHNGHQRANGAATAARNSEFSPPAPADTVAAPRRQGKRNRLIAAGVLTISSLGVVLPVAAAKIFNNATRTIENTDNGSDNLETTDSTTDNIETSDPFGRLMALDSSGMVKEYSEYENIEESVERWGNAMGPITTDDPKEIVAQYQEKMSCVFSVAAMPVKERCGYAIAGARDSDIANKIYAYGLDIDEYRFNNRGFGEYNIEATYLDHSINEAGYMIILVKYVDPSGTAHQVLSFKKSESIIPSSSTGQNVEAWGLQIISPVSTDTKKIY